MTNKEAIDYLRPVADSTPLVGYGAALNLAIKALETVEDLKREVEWYNRFADDSKEKNKEIDRLKNDLEVEKAYREFFQNIVANYQKRYGGTKR